MTQLSECILEAENAVSVPDFTNFVEVGNTIAPKAPSRLEETGVAAANLAELALKLAYTAPSFTTEWASAQLCLPMPLLEELLDQLKNDKLLEILGQNGPFNYRYAITHRGREQAHRLLEVCGYVGPAPVSLQAYTAMLDWQLTHVPPLTDEDVREALSELVLPAEAIQAAAMAVSSGRSLFVFGPAGNGKSSIGRMLHNALTSELWIPHCIGVESNIIRVFDPGCHHVEEIGDHGAWQVDRRWVRIRRPLIVVGGELTIEALDLAYSPALRYYEAPLHMKSNGGTLLIDDFGRQRVDPYVLLNRWIIPLEYRIDHLTLRTGQKLEVPFRQMLIVATNLNPDDVTDPAFLRRMGYRLYLGKPSPRRFTEIFENYTRGCGAPTSPGLLSRLLDRYSAENRELRCCEPRDLVERVRDFCTLHRRGFELTDELLDIAWRGYFGNRDSSS